MEISHFVVFFFPYQNTAPKWEMIAKMKQLRDSFPNSKWEVKPQL